MPDRCTKGYLQRLKLSQNARISKRKNESGAIACVIAEFDGNLGKRR
jgi:hypothetical protein